VLYVSSQQYSPGLENVIAATSSICTLDLERHVIVLRGYNLVELATKTTYEDVAYLTLYGHLPNRREYMEFTSRLREYRDIPKEVVEILEKMSRDSHPLLMMKAAVATLAAYDPELEDNSLEANFRKAERIIAKLATVTAAAYNIPNGRGYIRPKNDLPHTSNLFYMITGREPNDLEARIFEQSFTMYIEHELAVSTFAARVVASSMTDMYGAVISALAALKGPLHGRANEMAAKMIIEISSPENAEKYIQRILDRRERVMGFGHRVYRRGIDPRAEKCREMLKELSDAKGSNYYEIVERVVEIMQAKKNLYPNVDFYIGPLYHLLGIPIELYTPIFAASRIAGWTAHIAEQQANNRLFRPRARYEGPRDLKFIPLDERE